MRIGRQQSRAVAGVVVVAAITLHRDGCNKQITSTSRCKKLTVEISVKVAQSENTRKQNKQHTSGITQANQLTIHNRCFKRCVVLRTNKTVVVRNENCKELCPRQVLSNFIR